MQVQAHSYIHTYVCNYNCNLCEVFASHHILHLEPRLEDLYEIVIPVLLRERQFDMQRFSHMMDLPEMFWREPLLWRKAMFWREERKENLLMLFEIWLFSHRGTHPKVWSTLLDILEKCDISPFALEYIKRNLAK